MMPTGREVRRDQAPLGHVCGKLASELGGLGLELSGATSAFSGSCPERYQPIICKPPTASTGRSEFKIAFGTVELCNGIRVVPLVSRAQRQCRRVTIQRGVTHFLLQLRLIY